MTTIVSQLDKQSAAAALRELAPKAFNPRIFRSTFEGEVSGRRLTIGYRFGFFVPPIRLVMFSGELRQEDESKQIVGTISTSWIFYLLAIWLVVAVPFSIYRDASVGDYSGAIWSLITGVLLYFFGRAFLRSTQDFVVREIGRAVRGKIEAE